MIVPTGDDTSTGANAGVFLDDHRHPGIHDKPEKWDALWTKDLETQWQVPRGKLGNPKASIATHTPPKEAEVFAREENIVNGQAIVASVTRHQLILGSDVALYAVTHDYEKDWRALTDKQRKKVLLEGIRNAMLPGVIAPGRMYCPDSTVKFFSLNGGENYLKYLHLLIPDDLYNPTEPRMIPHAVVDRYLTITAEYKNKPGYKALGYAYQTTRIQCLTSIVYEIFHVFVSSYHSVQLQNALNTSVVSLSTVRRHLYGTNDSQGALQRSGVAQSPAPVSRQ